MHINEITQRVPTYQAQVRITGSSTVTTQIQATNITQARVLTHHFYGTGNVVSLLAITLSF